jgi:hypothetical protein
MPAAGAPLVEMQVGKIEAHSAKDSLNLGLQSTMWLQETACQAFQLSNPLLEVILFFLACSLARRELSVGQILLANSMINAIND